MKKAFIIVAVITLCLIVFNSYRKPITAQSKQIISQRSSIKDEIIRKLTDSSRKNGTVHVIAGLQTAFVPEGNLSNSELQVQRLGIKDAQSAFLNRFQSYNLTNVKSFEYIPFIAFETDSDALEQMLNDDFITSIQEDEIAEPALAESIPVVGADTAWASGYTGTGQTVAIVDSGVDKNHTFLAGKVISEACYSSNNASSTSVCPGGVTESTAPDSGLNCPVTTNGCTHGTHVTGIAAGNGTAFSGVAKGANVIAIQVFSQFSSSTNCGSTPTPCALYWTSDLIRGLERVRTLANTMPNIAAVNLSLQTGQQFTSNCDVAHAATKAAIDNLRSVGIPTIICSGNFAFTNALTAPACISTSISVGSTDDGSLGTTVDSVSSFSDSSPLLHLLAPGRWINSSIPGNGFSNFSGTSMATPHVVGAFAILKQKKPNATIEEILNALITTGQPITDSRNGLVKPRIRIGNALQFISKKTPFDFDGDGKTDISIFRPSVGQWWYLKSSNSGNAAFAFGNSTDVLAPGDFTGDGKTDICFWRPSEGTWYVLRSEDSSFFAFAFGANGDIPAPADYDGDGKTDPALFRPSEHTWYINRSTAGLLIVNFGFSEDKPIPADFDGDGKADIAIFRPSVGQWWYLRSSDGGNRAYAFGVSTDRPVPGDYTGDGKADIAFWRPADGFWYILRSEDDSFFSFPFGTNGDIPAPGDYDGDGKFDPTVFRPAEHTWYISRSSQGLLVVNFGFAEDKPVPSAFVP